MPSWSIVPLHVGTVRRDKSKLIYGKDPGTKVDFPVIVWLLQGEGMNILVDSGPCVPEKVLSFHLPMTMPDEQRPENAVRLAGVEPEEIDILINTHLHWDHGYNNALFPNARCFIQREEVRYAVAPLPLHAKAYEAPALGYHPPFLDVPFEVLDGDAEIVPGVTVLLTPGHSPGLQSVAVETSAGTYLLVSDTVPCFENWRAGTLQEPHLPNSNYVDLEAYYRTFARLERIGGHMLPGHDAAVFQQRRYP